MKEKDQRRKKIRKIVFLGSLNNSVLAFLKIIVGKLAFSHALIFDGLHSLTDLITDIFVFFVTKFSEEEPDEKHPYGHGKIETIATVFLGVFIIVGAVALAYNSIMLLISNQDFEIPQKPALIIAIFSMISNEVVFRYGKKVGEELNSKLIIANAWESRSDVFSSLIVFIGIAFSMYGYNKADEIAAILIALFIARIGFNFIIESLVELADSALEPDKIKEIDKVILSVDGVKGHHNLRARKAGSKTLVDVNIEVSRNISVSEGHEIASWTSKSLKEKFKHINDVVVHVDIENDLIPGTGSHPIKLDRPPLRTEVIQTLAPLWQEYLDLNSLDDIRLNYIGGKISLEIFLLEDKKIIQPKLNELASNIEWFQDIKILS